MIMNKGRKLKMEFVFTPDNSYGKIDLLSVTSVTGRNETDSGKMRCFIAAARHVKDMQIRHFEIWHVICDNGRHVIGKNFHITFSVVQSTILQY